MAESVVLGLSGGVDSAVAVVALQQAGYVVHGVTLRMHEFESPDAQSAAKAVAEQTRISYEVVDCRADFRKRVLERCWEEFSVGRTPNPCVFCNPAVKFAALMQVADRLGVNRVATGHYARLMDGCVWRGVDRQKDQSYFLWSLPEAFRKRLLFPLGDLVKSSVREVARAERMPNRELPESQDVCFSDGMTPFAELLRQALGAEERLGDFLDMQGNRLGSHKGIHRYTIGQRRGLGIALGMPARVASIDAIGARVTLSTDPRALEVTTATADHWLWQEANPPEKGVELLAQVRYHQNPIPVAEWAYEGDRVSVRFGEPVYAVTPGQTLAFYRGEQLVGGGILL